MKLRNLSWPKVDRLSLLVAVVALAFSCWQHFRIQELDRRTKAPSVGFDLVLNKNEEQKNGGEQMSSAKKAAPKAEAKIKEATTTSAKSELVFRMIVEVHGKEPRNAVQLTNDVTKPICDAIQAPIINRVSRIVGKNLSIGMVLPIAVGTLEGKEGTNERRVHFRVPINIEQGISREEAQHMAHVLENEIREPIEKAATEANSKALYLQCIVPMKAE